jgi:type IV secretory pathway VirJ component
MRKLLVLLCALACASAGAETISHGRFENVAIYRPQAPVKELVLLLSGSDGWDRNAEQLAQALTEQGAMVAGISTPAFFAELERDASSCVFPDGDLENLSHFLQAYYHLPGYAPPILAGYAASAGFVYAMLAQAPQGTFAGGLSVGFCPELPLKKPLCEAERLHFAAAKNVLAPAKDLQTPWTALENGQVQSCPVEAARPFVTADSAAEMVVLPDAAPQAQPRAWLPQWKTAFARLSAKRPTPTSAAPGELQGLPVVEVGAQGDGDTLALLVSGDGGWAGIDKGIAATLTKNGVPVVGLDSLRYFWTKRTPGTTAADIERILHYYLAQWRKQHALLIGYSQGADVLPFAVSRLPAQRRAQVRLAVLLAPSLTAQFEFHLTNWIGRRAGGYPVPAEIAAISNVPLLCVYGADETDSPCPQLKGSNVSVIKLPGAHHFDGNYDALAQLILAQMTSRR